MAAELEDYPYVAEISIQNASDTSLTLASFTLSNGQWVTLVDGRRQVEAIAGPIPGTVLGSGETLAYYNAASTALSPIGGSISFTPANGGSFIASWDRQPGSQLNVNGSISSNTLTVQSWGTNIATNSPTANYLLTNISSTLK